MAVDLKYVLKNSSKFKETHSAKLYKDGNNVYKIIEKDIIFYGRMINSIMYNYSIANNVDKHIILPTDLVYDDKKVRGYKMDYVKGKNLEDLAHDLSIDEKIKMLNHLTNLLAEINNYLVVSDVNLANCMYKKDEAFLIDFDLSSSLNLEPVWLTLYYFRNKNTKKEIKSSVNTDIVKMAIVVLSSLYEIDFERSFIFKKPITRFDQFMEVSHNNFIKDFFTYAFDCLNSNKKIDDYLYIPNNRKYLNDLDKDIKLVRGRIK